MQLSQFRDEKFPQFYHFTTIRPPKPRAGWRLQTGGCSRTPKSNRRTLLSCGLQPTFYSLLQHFYRVDVDDPLDVVGRFQLGRGAFDGLAQAVAFGGLRLDLKAKVSSQSGNRRRRGSEHA